MVMLSSGESAGVLPHSAHRAVHRTPQPLINKTHPAAAHHAKAPRHAAAKKTAKGTGTHKRARVVTAANPAQVQIQGSDSTTFWNLAQHITIASLTVGGAVVGIVFDESNPSDALLTGVY